MKNLFLWVAIILMLLPFLMLIDKRYFNFSNLLKSLTPALVSTIIFSELGVFFGMMKIWAFNPDQVVGIFYRYLPLEQYLFYYGFNFFSLALYQYWNARVPSPKISYSFVVSNFLIGLCLAVLFAGYSKWYTLLYVIAFMLILILVEYRGSLRYMPNYYRAVGVLLPLFAAIQIYFSQIGFYSFTWVDTLNASLFMMPLEHLFMGLGMILLSVASLEWIGSRKFRFI
ncbi:MAG: hypothetical protein EOO99_04905 [Pedobacter sp.]|nr:MAG: hypothetical protein EOO99_04905 [Pedobacter sp.]